MPWATQKLLRAGLFIALFASILTVGLFNAPVSADAVTGDDGIERLTDRWLRYRAVAGCYSVQDVGGQSIDDVNAGTWFGSFRADYRVAIGYQNDDGKVSCGDGSFITNSLKIIGFDSNLDAFCSVQPNVTRGEDSDDESDKASCMAGPGDFDMDGSTGDQYNQFKDAKAREIPDSAKFPYEGSGPIFYHIGLESLKKFCGGTRGEKYNDSMAGNVGDSKRKVVVNEVDLSTGEVVRYVYNLDKDEGDNISQLWAESGQDNEVIVADRQVNDKEMSCAKLAQLTWEHDQEFSRFVKAYNTANPDDVGSGIGEGEGTGEPVCSAGALGWVICPLMSIMVDVIEWVSDVLQSYLAFNPFDGADSDIRKIWTSLLNVANIMLVVAFLAVVFSQSTSIGLSNYGIKRMLPRIIIAAILMNLSYYICQILVDVSNILGVGVSSLVSATSGNTFSENVANVSDLSKIVVAAGLIAIVAFFFLIPVLLAFLAVIFTIAARNAIIVLLVIVAPLAFAAWILPNTEKYFKKWWELLINMLLLFPMVMLVFSASVVAANVIGSVNPSGGTASEELQGMIALLVLALPLFALPFLFKASSSVLGRINAMTQQRLQQGADSKAGQFVRDKTKAYGKFGAYAAGAGAARGLNKATRGKMFDPKNPGKLTRGYRNVRAFDKAVETSLEARKQGRDEQIQERAAYLGTEARTAAALGAVGGARYKAVATSHVDKAFEQAVSDAATSQKNWSSDRFDAVAQGTIPASSVAEQVAAARWVMANGNFQQRADVYKSINQNSSDRLRQTVSQQYYAKGDNKVIGSSWGGKLLEGTSGGEAGMKQSVASTIHAQKHDAQAMVHDADATKLIQQVASEAVADPSKYTFQGKDAQGNPVTETITKADLESLHSAARESLTNETTRTKATAGVFSGTINTIVNDTPRPAAPVQPQTVTVNSINNTVPAQNSFDISTLYGDSLDSYDATSLRSLIGNAAGGVNRLSDTDLQKIADRVRNETSADFQQISQEIANEQTARQTRQTQRQDQDAAYDSYKDNINE
ncbi:TPA: hypothetical protein DCF80_02590 [Candidatus Saccharibacteria bacterium]|nr:hypothetical protein [Candidatus Saccharibacteria bacterium]HRK40569.1 hypothetical protein [Candidatus Saccharibacteria bacterium]